MAHAQTRRLHTKRTAPKEQQTEDYWERRWLRLAEHCHPDSPDPNYYVSAAQLREAVDRWEELDRLARNTPVQGPPDLENLVEAADLAEVARRRAFRLLQRFYRGRGMDRWWEVAAGVLTLPRRKLKWDPDVRRWVEMEGPFRAAELAAHVEDPSVRRRFMLTPKAAQAVRIWAEDLELAHQSIERLNWEWELSGGGGR